MRKSAFMTIAVIGVLLTPLFMAVMTANAESRGSRYYQQYCSSCHGRDGQGRGPRAHRLATLPADLTRIAQRRGGYFPERQILDYIDGRTSIRGYKAQEMPVWGRHLSEMVPHNSSQAEARKIMYALVKYLKTIQKGGID